MSHNFRDIMPKADDPRLQGITERDACQHADHRLAVPRIRESINGWLRRQDEPYFGITTHGEKVPNLYHLADEGAPTAEMVAAARALLNIVTPEEAQTMRRPIDSPQWRGWSNPELYISRYGLRLEEVRPVVRDAILAVLKASMSEKGYEKSRNCMRMNHFLGQIVNAPKVMNEWSYNFLLYGEPSLDQPWGWNFYGHHLCLNCFILDGQMVISPTFMGAEPNYIDEGPWKGLSIFNDEEMVGLDLMRSLDRSVQEQAVIYKQMKDPAMPEGRWHMADQRHLGGAFQDNRVIPYEGVKVTNFSKAQQQRLMDLVEVYIGYLPAGPLKARMSQVEQQMSETRFAWIGGYGEEDVFYYKIHSPVIMIEFDHHSGVFLTNQEPWKCHIHTLVRTPNGNDYGKDLLQQHYDKVHPGHGPGGQKARSHE